MIGETLDDKYKIIRLLGQGGMGCVYEAEHVGMRRRVAVKVIGGDLKKRGADLVNRFQREAKAASAIDTEHIAQVFDAGTDRKTNAPYLVMEYLDGEDLQHLIERTGPLQPEVALKIVAQACVGLAKAHAARVVHRDIKPANLFLARGEGREITVKLLDFGIAKIKGDPVRGLKTSDLTDSGSLLGSPLFMSPEQVQDSKALDYRTDLWSLGVVLYCVLAGRAPHEDIKNFALLIIALCEGKPRPIHEVAPWVSPQVARVVHGALEKDPASRFPSAQAMLEAIERLLPRGLAIDREMLVPLDAQARSVIAPSGAGSRNWLWFLAALAAGLGGFALSRSSFDVYLSREESDHEFVAGGRASEALADDKRAAREHFDRGKKLSDQGAWEPALAEFLASRRIYPTRSAAVNAAVCLKKLKRFDEAFEMLEPLLQKDGSPSEIIKDKAVEQ